MLPRPLTRGCLLGKTELAISALKSAIGFYRPEYKHSSGNQLLFKMSMTQSGSGWESFLSSDFTKTKLRIGVRRFQMSAPNVGLVTTASATVTNIRPF